MQQTRPLLVKVFFLLLTMVILIFNFHIVDDTKREASADQGILDLSRYDFKTQGKLSLDGEWQFYYGRFMKPVRYSDWAIEEKPDLYAVPPTLWNYYEVDGKPVPGFGFGTYRMIVTGVKPGLPLAIKMLPQATAYEFFIDGELLARNGKVAGDAKHSAPGYFPNTILFTPDTEEFVITIHISNYVFARGGLWDAPTLGMKSQIDWINGFVLQRDLFLLGCYAMISLLFFAIYLYRSGSRARLYFALLCFVAAARVTLYGAHLITQITENYRLITFLEYATRYWFPVLLLLTIHAELSGRIPKKLLAGLVLLISVITIATAVLPIHIYTAYARVLMGYDLLMGLGIVAMLLCPCEWIFPRKRNKMFFLYGILAILFCAVYDMFFSSSLFLEMTPVGFFVAVLAFAFLLAITYSDALAEQEKALHVLEAENKRKLQTELKLLQSQIRPHFLYNALSAIANVCTKDGNKAEQLILDLAYFMQAGFDFNSSDRMTTLENELEYIRKYVNIETARFGEIIKYTEEIGVPLETQLPRLIIEPLVENAIRHGISKKKGGGAVRLKVAADPAGIVVEVYDNGAGMAPEKLADVFKEESRSVGLKNIQNRLLHSGSTGLKIESVQNEYTIISFMVKGDH